MTRCLRMTSLVLAVLLCLRAVSAFAASSPEESIHRLQEGVDNAETERVLSYLDIDQVVGRALDAALKHEEVLRITKQYPPLAFALSLGGGLGTGVIQDFLTAEVKQFVLYGVSSGAFAGRPHSGKPKPGGLMDGLLRGGAKDRKIFGEAITRHREGDTALVSTSLFDAGSGETYPLELKLERQNTLWRVMEITNIQQHINRVAGAQ